MSDENSKNRRPQRGPGRAATAPGGAKRTMIGLPISDPRRNADDPQDPARPGHRPATSDTVAQPGKPHGGLDDGYIADKLYMEPPSETFGRAPTHAAIPAPQHAAPAAHAVPAEPEPERAPNFAAGALRAAQVERGTGHNPAGTALHAAQQTVQERIPAPRTSFSSPPAPEAWRNDVRRMADRGTTSQIPRPAAAGNASLRLKLDSAEPDDHYRGVPKSSLPSVLLWLFLLAGAAAAAAYWVDAQGGLVAARTRLESLVSGHPVPAPTVAAPTPPTAETSPSAPATPPPSAAPTATTTTTPPTAAATPTQAQGENAAQALADPEPPTAAPSKPEPAHAEAKPKPEEKPKPAAAKPAAPAPPRRVVRHEPVLTVKPMGSSAAPPSNAPPEPAGTPFVPNMEPPAPDDSH
jgi:hypothetical protein